MKVALVKPPSQGSQGRGIGFYADRLFKSLQNMSDLDISWMTYSKNPFAYQKFDLVHFPYFDLFNLTIPPVRVSRTVVTLHDVIPLKFPHAYPKGPKAKTFWSIQKNILHGVDAVLTDSETSKKDIIDLTKTDLKKIFVTPLAADSDFKPITSQKTLARIREKYHLPEKFVLYVGGVNWNKNLPTLVKASPVDIVFVGKEFQNEAVDLTHPELASFKELLSLIKANSKVHRLGFVQTADLVAIHNLASVYVQPSRYEGFGLPLLEAMACGTPCVAGKNSSLLEIGGKAVSYFDSESIDELKTNITKMMNLTATEREKLAEKLQTQAHFFSWTKTAEETFNVYTKVLFSNV